MEEATVAPNFPAYYKGLPEACGAFVRTYYPTRDGERLRKKKISSYGIRSIMLASKIAEGLNPNELLEGHEILSRGIKILDGYGVKDQSLAGTYNMKGNVQLPPLGGLTGGSAPLEGRLTEDDTSGYDDFFLTDSEGNDFLPGLQRIIDESAPYIRAGLGEYCRGDDRTIKTILDNLYGRERLLVKHSNSAIRYVKSIDEDVAYMHALCTYLEKDGLLGIHELSYTDAAERIRESGMKLMNPIAEKMDSPFLLLGGAISISILGAIISSKMPNSIEPYFLMGTPILAASGVLYGFFVMTQTSIDHGCFKAMNERVGHKR